MQFKRILLAALAVLLLATAPAFASSVHLKGGRNAEPAFADGGLTLSATGALSGLGNGDVLVTLAATGQPTATCTNPAGATQPPGQNPAEVVLTGTQAIPESELKNGTTPFGVITIAPTTPIAGAPDCPNPQWTEDIVDVSFTSAMLTIEQPAGTTVLTVNCSISPSSSDGEVPGSSVSCTSS